MLQARDLVVEDRLERPLGLGLVRRERNVPSGERARGCRRPARTAPCPDRSRAPSRSRAARGGRASANGLIAVESSTMVCVKLQRPPVRNSERRYSRTSSKGSPSGVSHAGPLVGERRDGSPPRDGASDRPAQDAHLRQVIDRGAGEDVQSRQASATHAGGARIAARRAHRGTRPAPRARRRRSTRAHEPSQVVAAQAFAGAPRSKATIGSRSRIDSSIDVGECLGPDRREEAAC